MCKAVWYRKKIDGRSQVFSLKYREFTAINSNAIIQETNTLFEFFRTTSQIYTKFWTFPKKMINFGLRKAWLGKRLRSLVLKHGSTVNMLKNPINCWNPHDCSFIISSFTVTEVELQNVSLSDIWNLRTVC